MDASTLTRGHAPATRAAARARLAASWREWRPSLLRAVVAVAAFRLAAQTIGTLSAYGTGVAREVGHNPAALLHIWTRWDAGWYLGIAARGYVHASHVVLPGGAVQDGTAFAPLYPLLMQATSAVLRVNLEVAGVLVATIALVAALAGIHRLARFDLDERGATLAVVLAAVYPTAVFFAAIYAESLVLAAVAWTLVAARERRWWLASALAGVAVLAKFYTIIVIVALAIEYMEARRWRGREIRWDAVSVVAGPALALGGVMLAMARVFADPLRFLHAEATWQHALAGPWTAIAAAVHDVTSAALRFDLRFMAAADLVTVALLAVAAVYAWFRMRRSYAAFILLSDIVFCCSSVLRSTSRYALAVVPIYLVGARLIRRRPALAAGVVLTSSGLCAYLINAYTTNRWAG